MAINATSSTPRPLASASVRAAETPTKPAASQTELAALGVEEHRNPASEEAVAGSRKLMQGLERSRVPQMFDVPGSENPGVGPQAGIKMTCGRGGKCG